MTISTPCTITCACYINCDIKQTTECEGLDSSEDRFVRQGCGLLSCDKCDLCQKGHVLGRNNMCIH
jgi:hypothetical protein